MEPPAAEGWRGGVSQAKGQARAFKVDGQGMSRARHGHGVCSENRMEIRLKPGAGNETFWRNCLHLKVEERVVV